VHLNIHPYFKDLTNL